MYCCEDEFEVRGYELDSFGHLNNAVYLNYLEVTRWNFCRNCNLINEGDNTFKYGLFLVVIETSIRYIRELKLFDRIIIKSKYRCDDLYLYSEHIFLNKETDKKVSVAKSKLVYVNNERIVCNVPNEIAEILLR